MFYNDNIPQSSLPREDNLGETSLSLLIQDVYFVNLMLGKLIRRGFKAQAISLIKYSRLYLHLSWQWSGFYYWWLNTTNTMFRYIFLMLKVRFNRKLMRIKRKAGSKRQKFRYYDISLSPDRRFNAISCWIDFFLDYYYHRLLIHRYIHFIVFLRYSIKKSRIKVLVTESGDRNYYNMLNRVVFKFKSKYRCLNYGEKR